MSIRVILGTEPLYSLSYTNQDELDANAIKISDAETAERNNLSSRRSWAIAYFNFSPACPASAIAETF